MEDDFNVKNLKMFNGQNFQACKFQMRAILVAKGLNEIVTRARAIPSNEEVEERKEWITDNAKAMYYLSSSLDSNQMDHVLVCNTAHQMWTSLNRIHEQTSAANKLLINQRFHEYRMNSSDSAITHFSKVQNLAKQLLDVGELISETAAIAKILASLPPKYNILKSAWDSASPENQTLVNLQERLLKEDHRMEAEEETTKALAAMTINKNRNKSLKPRKDYDKNHQDQFHMKHHSSLWKS